MSNSRKYNPIGSWCVCRSEKTDKQIWHGRFRAANNAYCLRQSRTDYIEYDDDYVGIETGSSREYRDQAAPHIGDVSDPWTMSKDGKGWHGIKNTKWTWYGLRIETEYIMNEKQCGTKTFRRGRVKYIKISKDFRK